MKGEFAPFCGAQIAETAPGVESELIKARHGEGLIPGIDCDANGNRVFLQVVGNPIAV